MEKHRKYRIAECVPAAFARLGHMADDLANGPFGEFVGELHRELDGFVSYLDADALPPVPFDWWYADEVNQVGTPGTGVIAWPNHIAHRLTVELRLLWQAVTVQGFLGNFCLLFIEGTSLVRPDTSYPAFIQRVLKPFVKRFDRFVNSGLVELYPDEQRPWRSADDVWRELLIPGDPNDVIPTPRVESSAQPNPSSEPAVAVEVSTHTNGKPLRVDRARVEHLVARREDYDHFLDGTGDRATAWARLPDGTIREKKVYPGRVAMIAAMANWAVTRGGPFDLEGDVVPEVSTVTSRRETFKGARTDLDVAIERSTYRLFRSARKPRSQALNHWFEPMDGVTYCLLFDVELFGLVEAAGKAKRPGSAKAEE